MGRIEEKFGGLWEACSDCDGARAQGEHCLTHVRPSELEDAIARWRLGEALDARRVSIPQERLAALLDGLRGDDGRPRMPRGGTNFSGARFSGEANFRDARFEGDANFRDAQFSGDANFQRADFRKATFCMGVDFTDATFEIDADFGGAYFWPGPHSRCVANFSRATFGIARFAEAEFHTDAQFHGAVFGKSADFDKAQFAGDVAFDEVRFESPTDLGPLALGNRLWFDKAVFTDSVRIRASARQVSLSQALFKGRTDVRLRYAEVWLEDAEFSEPSIIAALPHRVELCPPWELLSPKTDGERNTHSRTARQTRVDPEPVYVDGVEVVDAELVGEPPQARPHSRHIPRLAIRLRTAGRRTATSMRNSIRELYGASRQTPRIPPDPRWPTILSLRRSRVARLTLSQVNLESCWFAGADGLDGLRLETAWFAEPPRGWRRPGWRPMRPVRWTFRQTVAEEGLWRDERGQGWDQPTRPTPARAVTDNWRSGETTWPPVKKPDQRELEQIEGTYRALRKGREDSTDAPGAGDFYYGEMEMRRHSGATGRRSRAERLIVALYWLVSGYGLRAWRAIACLTFTILLGGLLLDSFGFHPDRSLGHSVLFSLESTITLLRAPPATPPANLTPGGEIVQISLRLLGPLFFGLALLAVRGRVKR
jgi:uncharacterized protein YjbI with pentapeptide repeats